MAPRSSSSSSPPSQFRVRTLADIAKHFGIAAQTVDKWRLRGMPGTKRSYDLQAIGRWLVMRQSGDSVDPDVAKMAARKLAAETNAAVAKSLIVQFRAKAMAGEYLDREAVCHEVGKMCAMVRNELEALPSRLTELLPTDVRLDAEISMEGVIHRVLTRLADKSAEYAQAKPVAPKKKRRETNR